MHITHNGGPQVTHPDGAKKKSKVKILSKTGLLLGGGARPGLLLSGDEASLVPLAPGAGCNRPERAARWEATPRQRYRNTKTAGAAAVPCSQSSRGGNARGTQGRAGEALSRPGPNAALPGPAPAAASREGPPYSVKHIKYTTFQEKSRFSRGECRPRPAAGAA